MIREWLRSIWGNKSEEDDEQEEPKKPLEWNRLATFDEKDEEYYATHGPKGPSWERAMKALEMSENEQHWNESYDIGGTKDMKLNVHVKDFMDISSEQLGDMIRAIAKAEHYGPEPKELESAALTEQYEKSLAEYEKGLKESPYKRLCEWIENWSDEDRMLLAYELRYELEANGLNDLHFNSSAIGRVSNYYEPPDKFDTFDDAIQWIRETKIEGDDYADTVLKDGRWRVMSIRHRLYSLYLYGDFKGCIQLPVGEKMPEEDISDEELDHGLRNAMKDIVRDIEKE